ncbi:MAG TPA: lamin tail domain-containing protein [Candidatus Nanopelagicales bacterium]|nr:lamin tail domain-containing protein [Candidatus Nanopelagicales bacterium]
MTSSKSTRTSARRTGALALAAALGVSMAVALPQAAHAAETGVVISELNYHAVSDLDTDDFLELTNTSSSPVDMSGWSFSAGVTAVLPSGTVLPAGGRFVLSPDATAFAALHGFAPDALYTGKLSNGGETVTLVDAGLAVVDTVTYADAAPWTPLADGTGPSLELRGLLFDNTDPDNWGPSSVVGGTPKAVNSLDGTAPPPKVKNVTATPQRPDPGQAIVVTGSLPPDSTATLSYKVMFGTDVTIPFVDDAASPGGAGDGVYAATIPGQAAGLLVRYRIDAGFLSVPFSFPAADDTTRYTGVVVKNPAAASQLPVFEWFMQDAVYNDLLANHRFDDVTGDAVIAYEGTVYDSVKMRIRGNTSRTRAKVSWKVELPAGHTTSLGGRLPYALDEFALQRDADPTADMGWYTVRSAGARALTIFPVRSQRNGAFWSLGRIMETEDGTWRDAQGVSKWSIYKGDGGSLAKTASPAALEASLWLDKKTRDDEDYTDAWQLSQVIDAPASASQRAWILKNVNVPELINYMAINSVMRHADSGWYNWWIARDTEGTGRWEMWHWDLNWVFTHPSEDGKGVFLTPDTNNRFTTAMLAYPDFKQMFMRRLRTLADQLLVPPAYENLWDTTVAPGMTEWNLDRALWGGYSPAGARTEFTTGLADRRTTIAANTGPGLPVPVSQSAAPDVVINEIMYKPAGGDDGEYVELTNPSSTESVDLSGWQIPEIGLTIAPGTVILPKAQLVFVSKDTAFRALYPSGDRIVAGQFSGHLSDTGQTLTLTQGARTADVVTYGSADPWPAAAAGTGPSLELSDPSLDNALASSWSAGPGTGTPGLPNSAALPPDTTAPGVPAGLAASNLTSTGLTLSWQASTDDRGGPVSYEVSRNGTPLPRTSGLTLTETGLTPSTTYVYTVRAFDGSGNGSNPSASVTVVTPSASGALLVETWPGANASPWSSVWTGNAVTGSVVTNGGAGQLVVNDTSGAYARSALTGLAARADSQVLFSYVWSSRTASAYFSVYVRGSGGWQNAYRPRNGYGLEFASNSSTVAVKRNVNGTTTTIATASAQPTGTGKRWVRLRVSGSTIQFRTWADGTAEPATWSSTATDTGVTASGQLYLSLVRGSTDVGAKTVSLDDLQVFPG